MYYHLCLYKTLLLSLKADYKFKSGDAFNLSSDKVLL